MQRQKPRLLLVDPGQRAANDASLDLGRLADMTGYALRRAQLTVFDDFIAALGEVDLKPAQYSVLHVLDVAPGCRQSAVAAALGIQRANFVALLDELERRGLARRAASPTDKRSHALFLTDAGRQLLSRARVLEAEHQARQIDRVGGRAEHARLLDLLRRLVTAPPPASS